MLAPGDTLIIGQTAGALSFEVEEALSESFRVIESSSEGESGEEREEETEVM